MEQENPQKAKESSLDDVITPIVRMTQLETSNLQNLQEQVILKLNKLNHDLIEIKRGHFSLRDKKIDAYLKKIEIEHARMMSLKEKIETLQQRVNKIETTFRTVKGAIPELEESFKVNS